MTRRSIEQDIARQMRAAERERRRMAVAAALIGGAFVLGGGLLAWGWLMRPGTATAPPVTIEPAQQTTEPVTAQVPRIEPDAVPTTEPERPDEPALADEERGTAPEPAKRPTAPPQPEPKPAAQRLSVAIGDLGYEPAVVQARPGAPIVLTVAQGEGCAAGFLMPELGVAADNSTGPVTVKLPALSAGTYRFTCGMEMVEGRLVVQ